MASHVVYSGNVFVKFTGGEKGFLSKKRDWKLRVCDLVLVGSSCSLLVSKLKPGDKKIPFFKIDITKNSVLMTIEHDSQFYFYFQHDRDSEFFVKDKHIENEWIRAIENCISTLISSDVSRSYNSLTQKSAAVSHELLSEDHDHDDHRDESSVVSSLDSVTVENKADHIITSFQLDRIETVQAVSKQDAQPQKKVAGLTSSSIDSYRDDTGVKIVSFTGPPIENPTNNTRSDISSSIVVESVVTHIQPTVIIEPSLHRSATRGRVLLSSSATSRVGESEPVRRGPGRSVAFSGGGSVSSSSDSLSLFETHNLGVETHSPPAATGALLSPPVTANRQQDDLYNSINGSSMLSSNGMRAINGSSAMHPQHQVLSDQHKEAPALDRHISPETGRVAYSFNDSSSGTFGQSSTRPPLQATSPLPQYSSNTPYSDMRRSRTPGPSDVPTLLTQSLTMEDLRVSDRHQLFVSGGIPQSAFSPTEIIRSTVPTRDEYKPISGQNTLHQEGRHQSDAMRLREIQALAALNDELNAALEGSEEGRRNDQEDFARQIAGLEAALRESEASRRLSMERDEEESTQLTMAKEELRRAREDAAASKEIQRTQNNLLNDYHEQITALTERIKGGAGYVDVTQIEEMVSLARAEVRDLHAALGEKDRELDRSSARFEALQQTLDSRSEEVAAKEQQLVEAALARETVQLQLKMSNAKIDSMLVELDHKADFVLKESQLQDKVHALERDLQRSAIDTIAFRGSEESYKLSVVRLESLVKEQQAFVDDMSRQLLHAADVKKVNAELTAQLNASREECAVLDAARNKTNRAFQDTKSDLARAVQDRKDDTIRHDQLVDTLRADYAMLQSQLKKVTLDETHLTAEVSVVQRHLEANREQYLQLERDHHELQRHSQLEVQSFGLQKSSLQDSLEVANKTVRELQNRCRSLEDLQAHGESEHKKRVMDLEEIINGLRRSNKDTVARTYLLEEQINKLTHSLTTERSSHTALLEQFESLQNQRHYEDVSHQSVTKELQETLDAQIRSAKDLKHQLLESELFRRDGSEKHVLAYREVNMNLATAESSNRQLRDDIATLAAERQLERTAMEERIASQMTLNEACQLKILELERQLSTLTTGRNIDQQRFSTTEAELQASVRRLTAANEAVEEVLREEHETNNNNRQLIASLRAEAIALSDDKGSVYRDFRQLKELSANLQQELELLTHSSTRERAELLRSVEDLQGEVARGAAQLKQQTGSLSDNIRELDAAKLQLIGELESTMVTLEEYQLRFQVAEELNAALKSQLVNEQKDRTRQVEVLQAELASTQSELTQRVSQVEVLSEDVRAASQAFALLSAQFTEKDLACRSLSEDRRVQSEEITQLHRHIENLKRDLAAAERQSEELTAQLEHSKTTIARQAGDIAALNVELDQLRARLAEGRDLSAISQDRISQLEHDLKATKGKLRDMKGLHEAATITFKDQSSAREVELQSAMVKTRRLEALEGDLRQTIASITSKMTEMMPISEAERQLDELKVTLTAETRTVSSEKQKYVTRTEALSEKVAAGQKESNAALHRLRHLLASLSTYIESRDVTYEYKKGVGLSQAAVQYKDNTVEETLLSTEEHVGRLLRDFNALRNSAADTQVVLQREQLTHTIHSSSMSPSHSSETKHDRNSPLFRSPTGGGEGHHPTDLLAAMSVSDLIRDNKRLLDMFVHDSRDRIGQLERQLSDEQALKSLRETLVADLNERITTYEDQVRGLKAAKLAAEQRHSNEITLIQQDYNRSLSEFESREDDHARATLALTKSHEIKIERLQNSSSSTAEQLVQDERAICQSLTEKLNQQFSRTEASLKIEIDRLRADCHHLQEQARDLSRESEHKSQELHAASVRYEAIQHEVDAKVRQLETCLSQLERAELKAAKESREKLDLERVLRRFKSSADLHNSSAPHGDHRHSVEEEEEEEKFSSSGAHNRSHTSGLSSSATQFSHPYVTPRPASSSSSSLNMSQQLSREGRDRDRDASAESRHSAIAASVAARALSESRSRSAGRSHDNQLRNQQTSTHSSSNNRDASPSSSSGLPRKGSFRITEYLDNQKKRRVASAERSERGVGLSADLRGSSESEGGGDEEEEEDFRQSSRPTIDRADRIPAISHYRQNGESFDRTISTATTDGNGNTSRLKHSSDFAESTSSRIEQVMRAKGWSKTSM